MNHPPHTETDHPYDELCHRARRLADLKRWVEARQLIEEAIRLDPEQTEAHALKAEVLLTHNTSPGDLRTALDSARRVTALDPEAAQGYALQSFCHRMLDEPARALETARQTLARDPDDRRGFHVLAEALLLAEDLNGAKEAAEEVRKRDPLDTVASELQGRIALHEGRFEDAERLYRTALALAPEDPGLITYLAFALEKLGRRQESLELFTLALKQDPNEQFFQENLEAVSVASVYRHPAMIGVYLVLLGALIPLYASFKVPWMFQPHLKTIRIVTFLVGLAAFGGMLALRRYLASRLNPVAGIVYRMAQEQMDYELLSAYKLDPEWVALGIGGAVCVGWLYYAVTFRNDVLLGLVGLAPVVLVLLGALWFIRRRADRNQAE